MEMHYHHHICTYATHHCLMLIPGNHKDLLCFYIIMWAIFSPVIKGGLFCAPDPLACYLEEVNFHCDNNFMFMIHMSSKWAWHPRISLSWCSIWFLYYLPQSLNAPTFYSIPPPRIFMKKTIYTPLIWMIEVHILYDEEDLHKLKKWIFLDQNGRFLSHWSGKLFRQHVKCLKNST